MQLGGAFGEGKCGADTRARDAGEEDFFRRGGLGCDAQNIARLLVREQGRLTAGAEDDESGGVRLRGARDVCNQLGQVEASIRVEGSGQRDVKAFEQHWIVHRCSLFVVR